MKCHYCQRDMVKLPDNRWTLSCPQRHGHVLLDKDNNITAYRLYLYPDSKTRITIEQSDYNGKLYLVKHTKIPKTRKNRKGQIIQAKAERERKVLLTLDYKIPPKLDNEIIQANLLHEKLKIYLLFS